MVTPCLLLFVVLCDPSVRLCQEGVMNECFSTLAEVAAKAGLRLNERQTLLARFNLLLLLGG